MNRLKLLIPAAAVLGLAAQLCQGAVYMDIVAGTKGKVTPPDKSLPSFTVEPGTKAGHVELTLDMPKSFGAAGTFVSEWAFSLVPGLEAGDLTFRNLTPESAGAKVYTHGTKTLKDIKPSDSKDFSPLDFSFIFETGKGTKFNRFIRGEQVTFDIWGKVPLTADMFSFAAMHVNDYRCDKSIKLVDSVVPEPYQYGLVAMAGLIGLAWRDRRLSKRFNP
jgi:hypothetical protein